MLITEWPVVHLLTLAMAYTTENHDAIPLWQVDNLLTYLKACDLTCPKLTKLTVGCSYPSELQVGLAEGLRNEVEVFNAARR